MIPTEEQRGTVAFDLEKARAVDIDLLAATDWGELRARYRAALDEIERLRGEMENYGDDYVCQMKSKDARIQELEDALVEERVQVIAYQIPHAKENVNWAPVFKLSRQQLRAEGKVGPDARPRSWKITEERVRAIRLSEELAWDCKVGDVLRAMLKEAGV
jgi:hypothetical protein